ESRGTRGIVEAIVEAEAKLMQRDIRLGACPGRRKDDACARESGPEIFAPHGPARGDRGFDPDAGGPAEPPQEAVFRVAGIDLYQRLLVVGPGETAGCIKQPVARRVADPAAHRA